MIDSGSVARTLVRHWRQGSRIDAIAPSGHPSSRAEGYAIQACWPTAAGSPAIGWKIAATSAAGQRHINVDAPLAGRLLAYMRLEAGATVPLAHSLMRVAEVEIAFRFASALPPRPGPYGVDEVLAAVGSVHPAIEFPDSRFADFCAVGAASLIADDACADRFMLGPAAPAWRHLDLAALSLSATVNGSEHHDGRGSNALGDPRVALAWIVNELSGLGLAMGAGEFVITGACVKPVPVVPGDEFRASYGELGEMSARFA